MTLQRKTGLRRRSASTAKAYRDLRQPLVISLLAERPWCEVPSCTARSQDVHEVKTRARGGSILEVSNLRCVCRAHHDEIGTEPPWAYELGFLKHSWDPS